MHQTKVTYFTWIGKDLITVPDFPAWVCDICGRMEYDHKALNKLTLLLSPSEPRNAYSKASQPSSQQDHPSAHNQPTQTE
ncbi:MAG: YgiT-type zinc finger protein [Anaerolineaceae bacterium]|nr:YgiT-type zinc finger protein [Anaerolineaceae bacterium]